MLWYKSWRDTRWRFLVGLVLLVCWAVAMSMSYPRMMELVPHAFPDYRSYAFSNWYQRNGRPLLELFGVLLGSGGALSQFTLSLPVTRGRVLSVRAGMCLAELLVLAIVPSLAVGLGAGDALVHGLCLFIGGAVFYSVTVLLSTMFSDVWLPAVAVLCTAGAFSLFGEVFPALSSVSVVRVMSGEVWFRSGSLPWLGLVTCAAVSVGLLYAATINLARRDF